MVSRCTGERKIVGLATLAQVLSPLATLIVALGIPYQGRQARRARDDAFRPQIIVDADYTGRFTTNIVARNIGGGAAKDITFEFSAPIETSTGWDIIELPYFTHGINFMVPQTERASKESSERGYRSRDLRTPENATNYCTRKR